MRTRLMPQATAAVLITRDERIAVADVRALARNFDLTAAETRLLQQLVRNATLADAARALGVSQETARTHLAQGSRPRRRARTAFAGSSA